MKPAQIRHLIDHFPHSLTNIQTILNLIAFIGLDNLVAVGIGKDEG